MQITNFKYENQIRLACCCVTAGHAVGHAVLPCVMLVVHEKLASDVAFEK